MKILVITDLCRGNAVTLPERALFRGLREKGADLQVITHWETPETREVEESGVKVHYIKMTRKIDFRVIRQLRAILRNEKFDIVYLTFGKAITNALIAARGIDVGIVGYIGSLNVHWHDPSAYLSFLNRRIEKMVCLSDGVLEHLLKQAGSWMKERAVRIYKGYDPSWVKPGRIVTRAELNIPENALIIGCVANVRKVKGIPYLIKSANHLPKEMPVYYILVGKNMDSPYHLRLIKRSQMSSNFRVFGFTNDIFSYTALCDLYIQPSVAEGLGRSLIEAMCLSKPVIVTERGGSKELVDEGVNGFVVPSKSDKAIAEKIVHSYNIRTELTEMGRSSLKKIISDFSPQAMADQTWKVFNDLSAERKLKG